MQENNIVFNNLRHYDNLIKDYISKKSSNGFIEFEILDDSTKPPTISIPYEDFFRGELNDIPYLKFHHDEGEISEVYIGLPVGTQHMESEEDSNTFEYEWKWWIVILSETKSIQIGVYRGRNKTTSSDWEYEFYFDRRGDDNFEEEYNFMKAMVMPLIVCYGNMLYVKFPMTTVRYVDYYLDSISGDYDYGSESYYWGQGGDAVSLSSLPVPVGGTDTRVTLSNNINGKSGYIEQTLHCDTRYEYALNLHFVTNATDDPDTYEMSPKDIHVKWYDETMFWWTNERTFDVGGNYNRILYCNKFDDTKSHMSYDDSVPILGDDSFNDIYLRGVDWGKMRDFTGEIINAGNRRFEFCLPMFVNSNGGLGKMLKAFDYMYYKWNVLPYSPQ